MRDGNAISSRADDRRGPSAWFADHIAAALRAAPAARGLVALTVAWGSGKTSVLNMVWEQLEGASTRTVLTFNP